MPAYKDKNRNTWYVTFYYVDWTGERKRKLKRGFATKREAQEWEMHFELEKASNLDMTFEDFVSVYIEDIKPKLRENTWNTKEHMIRTKLLPYFKLKKMIDVKPRDIVKWQNEMLRPTQNGGKGYAPTYLKSVQAQLSCIFNHAVRYYDLPNNPVRNAGSLGAEMADEMLFWTKEEYLQFIPTMSNKVISYLAFEMLYWCGIRMGELRALTADDFDFEHNLLFITKSYQRIKGRDVITDPKTKKSKRTIAMPENVAKEMKDYIEGFYGLEPGERLFPISKSYLHHEMDRGCKESGVKRIRIHDLRHSHVSLLINMGFSALAIGNRVGHESEKITYRYAHLFPTVQDELATALDQEWKEGFDVGEDQGSEEPMEKSNCRISSFEPRMGAIRKEGKIVRLSEKTRLHHGMSDVSQNRGTRESFNAYTIS